MTDQHITPVFLDDTVHALRLLVEQPYAGIVHIAAADWTTPFIFAHSIARRLGLDEGLVVFKHALRNTLIPVVTVVGVSLPGLIAGTVIFEQIFIIPGMGQYLVASVRTLDYPVIEATNLVFATLLVFSVLLVDISYAFIDPRIRFR